MNDLKFAFRQLLKNPGFAAVAVLTLALGIGANTAIFTVINTVLLRSLPVRNPDELVQVRVTGLSGQPNYTFSYPFYERLRDGGRSLSGLFAAGGVGREDRLIVPNGGNAEVEFVRAQPVSGNFFSVLGVPAMLGRTISDADDKPGNPQTVAVISHSFWQRRFGSDASVVGKAITFEGLPFTIIGVTPPGFFGFQPGENPDLWWPLQVAPQVGRSLGEGSGWLRLMGRLSPGIERAQAETELAVPYQYYRDEFAAARAAKWSAEHRQGFFALKFELRPGNTGWTGLRDQMRQPLLILMAVVAAVLLIACANVASLLLARSAARQREFSIRSALGAGRLRVIRQLLTESLLLAALGGLLGLLFAQGGTRLLQITMRLQSDPISLSLSPDLRVLLFTTAAALLTGLLFGLAPAFGSSRLDLAGALKGTAGSVAGSARRQRSLQAVVVVQVGLSLMLLVGAGLFVRTLRHLKGMNAGFNRENVILFNVDFADRPEAARWTAFYKELIARLEALPGVRAASLFNFGFLSGNSWTDNVVAEGYQAEPGEKLECAGTVVGLRFFETLGMTLLSGRGFNAQDEQPVASTNATALRTAVINQVMARRYFGDANPLGKRFHFVHNPEKRFEIVGVMPDAKYRSLRESSRPTFYVPFFQESRGSWATLALRTSADPQAAMASLASVVREVDRSVRVRDLRTMNDVVNDSVHQERLIARLGGFFSIFALVLACLGLYGVLSFAVVQRTREIGVRVALGAQRRDVLSLVIGKGLKLVLIGALIGLAGALATTRLVSNLLHGVTPTDPVTFAGVALLLVVVAMLASWLPARRAAKVDPMEALRYE
ncbi:MAG TPA: ABC transporter permease [Verrucomicrobiae bacterium]|nr:ABC transporter permease [Verrucomicrobiae bacterium]